MINKFRYTIFCSDKNLMHCAIGNAHYIAVNITDCYVHNIDPKRNKIENLQNYLKQRIRDKDDYIDFIIYENVYMTHFERLKVITFGNIRGWIRELDSKFSDFRVLFFPLVDIESGTVLEADHMPFRYTIGIIPELSDVGALAVSQSGASLLLDFIAGKDIEKEGIFCAENKLVSTLKWEYKRGCYD